MSQVRLVRVIVTSCIGLGLFFGIQILAVHLLARFGFFTFLDHPYYSSRGIGNPETFLLYGVWGVFFRIREFGLIPMITLVMAVANFGIRKTSVTAREVIFLMVIVMVGLVIGAYGYANFRYSMTLVPLMALGFPRFLTRLGIGRVNEIWVSIVVIGLSGLLLSQNIDRNLNLVEKQFLERPTPRQTMVRFLIDAKIPGDELFVPNTIEYYYFSDGYARMLTMPELRMMSKADFESYFESHGIRYVLFEQQFRNLVAYSVLAEYLEGASVVIKNEKNVTLHELRRR